MAKYLVEASYTAEGARGLIKDGGTGRRKAIEEMCMKMDGKLESIYYAFGTSDVFVIVDLPNAVTAVAVSMAINQTGAVHAKTHVLLTPEEIDQAAKKSVEYRAPGK